MTGTTTPEDLEVAARVRGWVRQQMDERGINLSEAARRVGTSRQTMSRILLGERGIGSGLILRIVRGFHINPGRLLLEDPPEKYRDEAQHANGK